MEPSGGDPAKSVVDHVIDGITVASIVTVIAYAIVFGFEEGFNAFFQLPSDFVSTSLLSVFHVLTLVFFVLIHDYVGALALIVVVLLVVVPAFVYARHAYILAGASFVFYGASNLITPIVLLPLTLVLCGLLWRFTLSDTEHPGLLRLGPGPTKAAYIFILSLTPLFYCGFRYAEVQNPRLVFVDKGTGSAGSTKPARWVVARVLGDDYVTVRLLAAHEPVPGCADQYPTAPPSPGRHDIRPNRLSRDIRVIAQSDSDSIVSWNEFDQALNYCLFNNEVLPLWQRVSSALFIRQGPPPVLSDAPVPSPAPSPSPTPLLAPTPAAR